MPFSGWPRLTYPLVRKSEVTSPALTGSGYDHLEIQDGGTASLEYMRITFTEVPEDERQTARQNLIEYCGLDTRGMTDIVRLLEQLLIRDAETKP